MEISISDMPNEAPDKPIKIEFFITHEVDMSQAADNFGRLLANLANTMGVKREWIDRVVVAETECFANALNSFGGTREYTNSHGLLAVAKTIRTPNSAPVKTSIIFNACVPSVVLPTAMQKGWDFTQWNAEELRHFYVIFHELGHCADHALRPEITDDGTYRDANGERKLKPTFANLRAFHFSEMYPEIPACVFGSSGYSDTTRDADAKMNDDAFRSMLDQLAQLTSAPNPDLHEILKSVAATFWFVLFQHGKFVGSALGSRTLPKKSASELWAVAAAMPAVATALNRAETAISSAWEVYPEIPATLREELDGCFHEIARACGYSLEVRNGGEGVWWDRFRQWQVQTLLGND